MQTFFRSIAFLTLVFSVANGFAQSWVVYPGGEGPGKGKHVVLISGDEEYRSEEALPQLGKILSQRQGFKCTVLFAVDDEGLINPNRRDNIPGIEALDTADLVVMGLRFRDLPDDQMAHVVKYVEAGKPIVALRTSTHAFNIKAGSKYSKYSFNSKEWDGGFGRQILGETWISHHGKHGSQSTRGIVVSGKESHPILRGIKAGGIWGPTDVYGVTLPLPGDSDPLVLGEILEGMKPDDKPLDSDKNKPMMPVAWTKSYAGASGNKGRVFTTTMGASQDLTSEGTRRMIINACFWAVGLEDKIADKLNVELVGDYKPTPFKFNGFTTGIKPADHALPVTKPVVADKPAAAPADKSTVENSTVEKSPVVTHSFPKSSVRRYSLFRWFRGKR